MLKVKSIDNIFLLLIFTLILINALTLVFVSNSNESTRHLLIFVFVSYSLIILTLVNIKRIKTNFSILGLSIILYLVMWFIFRYVRNYFPKPGLKDSNIVGFAQYFGYPLYFDIFLFCFIIFTPLVSYFLIKLIKR